MNLQQFLHDKAEKNLIKYDDVLLKQMSCAHLSEDRQKFMSNDGIITERCRSCGKWDYE